MFIPLAIGVLLSAACAPTVNRHYRHLCEKHGGIPPPEARLIPMLVSCWFIPLGLFIFAWTSYPHVHWIVPIIGAMFCIAGAFLVFQAGLKYVSCLANASIC